MFGKVHENFELEDQRMVASQDLSGEVVTK